jgi:hypothetical protein
MTRTKTRAADVAEKAQTAARETVLPAAENAADRIGTAAEALLAQVADKVVPALEDARERLQPVAEEAVHKSREKSRRAAVRMGIMEEPKKSHKLRKLLMMLGLAGLAAWAYKNFVAKDKESAWKPATGTGSGTYGSAGGTSGTGAAGGTAASAETQTGREPDVAPTAPLPSEETVESPVPTTPDKPLEEKNLS